MLDKIDHNRTEMQHTSFPLLFFVHVMQSHLWQSGSNRWDPYISKAFFLFQYLLTAIFFSSLVLTTDLVHCSRHANVSGGALHHSSPLFLQRYWSVWDCVECTVLKKTLSFICLHDIYMNNTISCIIQRLNTQYTQQARLGSCSWPLHPPLSLLPSFTPKAFLQLP